MLLDNRGRPADLVALFLAVGLGVIFLIQIVFPSFSNVMLLDQQHFWARPWTIITSMFVHGSIQHLFSNAVALGMFGILLCNLIGRDKFLGLLLIAGIIANIVALFMYPRSLGASGAISGIIGTLAVLRPKLVIWLEMLPVPMALAAVIWIAIDYMRLFVPSGIASGAHLAGMAVGIAYGLYLRFYAQPPKKRFVPSHMRKSRKAQQEEDHLDEMLDDWERKNMSTIN